MTTARRMRSIAIACAALLSAACASKNLDQVTLKFWTIGREGEVVASPTLVNLARLGIGSMTVFNVVVVAVLSEKLVRYGYAFVVRGSAGKAKASRSS